MSDHVQPRTLKTHKNIGRFLVDSSPAFWMVAEGFLAWVFFSFFVTFGKNTHLPQVQLLNLKSALIFCIVFPCLGLSLGLYDRENRFNRLVSLQLILINWVLTTPLTLFALYLITFEQVGRWSLVLGSLGATLSIYWCIHWSGARLLKIYPHRFLYLGTKSAVGQLLLSDISRDHLQHYQHADEIDFASTIEQFGASEKIENTFDATVQKLREHSVSEVVVSWEKKIDPELSNLIFSCLSQGVRVVEDADYYEQIARRIPVEALPPEYVLKMGFDIHRPIYAVLKRLVDFVIAIAVGILCLPVLLIIALVIRLESHGPALYFQKRTGRFGKTFTLIKFRTMITDVGDTKYFAEKSDDRITFFGRLLRATHFDELPQLWNVLRGEMSLVGPRPHAVQMVEDASQFVPLFKLRHMRRPGLTGLAQLAQGKTTADTNELFEKLSYDLYYIKHFNIALDFWILSRTVFRLLRKTW